EHLTSYRPNHSQIIFMKNTLLLGVLLLAATALSAQSTGSTDNIYGTRQNWGGSPLNKADYPEIYGLLYNFKWRDLEPQPNVWNWTALDAEMMKHDGTMPFQLMIFTKEEAPDWLFTTGSVPKVVEYNSKNDSVGYAPYWADPNYKFYFERMIDSVANHVKSYPDRVKKYLTIQACIGE